MEFVAKNKLEYEKKDYWDKRFESEITYEWFAGYSSFKHYLKKDIYITDKILVLGCGNSSLSEELYKDGYQNIINIDYSKIVIDKMSEHYKHCPLMSWLVMDIFDLKFDSLSFDVVIEKGTLDSFMVNQKDPWRISSDLEEKLENILLKISSILKNGGKFISITFSQPHFRKPLYGKSLLNWSVLCKSFGDSFEYFYYKMVKGEKLSDEDQKNELNYRNMKVVDQIPVTIYEEDTEDFLLNINL
ncbi:EEF1A lysine methyltransferase 4 isoform X2 [Hydra vulgaris]|uniref:EEF1A lysine methyltransferase 4 isoform X2 n=1 Tax=Hydra vulgaris TaxID=6087 RepID=A0ABM4CXK0_HYDVU